MVDGCEKKHFGRGYCRVHYERWKRNGDVELRIHRGPCTIDGCDGRVVARLMCKRHYRRWQKYGDPLTPKQPMRRRDAYERWLAKVQKTDTCWLWTGVITRAGYGRFWFGDRGVLAHRWSYEHHVGPIGDRYLDHVCRVRNCVRPDHLEPVTQRENLLRGKTTQAAMNAAKTHCPRGHPYDEANTYRDKQGRRSCNTCRIAAAARYNERKRLAKQAE